MSLHDAEDIRRLMDHPVLISHDPNAKIIRAQLFFISVATIILSTTSITIGDGSSFLGIQLRGLTTDHIFTIASLLLAYQIFHFVWASLESAREWRARLTAMDTAGWGGGGLRISVEDQTNKVRQTTLYSYFTNLLNHDLMNIREKMETLASSNKEDSFKEIERSLNKITEILGSERVLDSLWRFDNWFKLFCKMQNFRWLILEFSLPVVLGLTAIYLALIEIIV